MDILLTNKSDRKTLVALRLYDRHEFPLKFLQHLASLRCRFDGLVFPLKYGLACLSRQYANRVVDSPSRTADDAHSCLHVWLQQRNAIAFADADGPRKAIESFDVEARQIEPLEYFG